METSAAGARLGDASHEYESFRCVGSPQSMPQLGMPGSARVTTDQDDWIAATNFNADT
jgi:hypothetical protein